MRIYIYMYMHVRTCIYVYVYICIHRYISVLSTELTEVTYEELLECARRDTEFQSRLRVMDIEAGQQNGSRAVQRREGLAIDLYRCGWVCFYIFTYVYLYMYIYIYLYRSVYTFKSGPHNASHNLVWALVVQEPVGAAVVLGSMTLGCTKDTFRLGYKHVPKKPALKTDIEMS